MILYLYALADELSDPAGVNGVAGEPIVLLRLPQAVVAAGWIEQAPLPTESSLTTQDGVVRTLHERAGALLPMRFGAAAADVDAVAQSIASREAVLKGQFELVRGREQMTLRIVRRSDLEDAAAGAAQDLRTAGARPFGLADPGEGTKYLQGRIARAIPPEIAPLLAALKPLTHASRVERGRQPEVVATVYHLIERGTSERYLLAARVVAGSYPSLKILMSGPAPAYAFT